METKIRMAQQVKDKVCGHFQWIFNSHDNPGRRQPDEAYRKIDKVGPFNYKGLLTPWEEPLDVYYMYKSNYVSPDKEPMVYLASHTWANRFESGPRKATIEAYSNCDSVLLYNDAAQENYLGSCNNRGIGTHFEWQGADIKYNVLRAVGYYKGKAVAEDVLVLDGLEKAPAFDDLYKASNIVPAAADTIKYSLKGEAGYNYIYRINCGGDNYTDSFGQLWMQDNANYSSSWTDSFIEKGDSLLSPYQASQRTTNDPIHGTADWKLFQSFRFGRHRLNYTLPVSNGKYRVELYFIEPWFGTGGSSKTDCEGMRLFDVAINGDTVIDDLDLWAEGGHDGACKKVVYVDVSSGSIKISFPEVKAAQAVISGIAVSTSDNSIAKVKYNYDKAFVWNNQDKDVMEKTSDALLPVNDNERKSVSYQAEGAAVKGNYTIREVTKQKGVFFDIADKNSITWNISTGLAQIYALRFKYINSTGHPVKVNMQLVDSKKCNSEK
jgi:Di-glucose binding within endoplasmic reticulum.